MFEKSLKDLQGLIRVSGGEAPPTMVIKDAQIFNVFTDEILRGNILIYKQWIAFVGDRDFKTDDGTFIIDAEDLIAVPGYFDAHGHADLFYNPATFGDFVVTKGATTVFSDAHDMINAIGVEGFEEVLKYNSNFSVKYIWGVPLSYPPYPNIEGGEFYSLYDIWKLFYRYKECVSASEVSSYNRILNNEKDILERLLIARSLNKNIEGHTLGASYEKLNVLASGGITSCHESVRENDVVNRLRLGFYVMIRHSSIRSDLEKLTPLIKDMPKDNIMLVTDGIFANDLIANGYMDFVLKKAIEYGIEPKDAIKMATINPARYFRLDFYLGSITPGRFADILLLEDIKNPSPVKVIERGRLVAENGGFIGEESKFPDIKNRFNPFFNDPVKPDELKIAWKGEELIPVIGIVDRTLTKRIDLMPKITDGYISADIDKDILKVCYTRRDVKRWGKGLVKGLGIKIGGMASTVAHETHGLLVVGGDDNDMVKAANCAIEMGGGVVLVDRGEIIYRLELPCGAIMSPLSVHELAKKLTNLNKTIREKGSTLDDPLWTICFLTFTSIVELRITISGIYDVRKGVIVY